CHHTVAFMNIDQLSVQIESVSSAVIPGSMRLVTGDIADSLALGDVSVAMHAYAAEVIPGSRFEMRSKCALPESFRQLDPRRFRMDWSLSPEPSRRACEPGTAPVDRRIESAARARAAGFEVGIRLDPLQPARIDRLEYDALLRQIRDGMAPHRPDHFVIGSYKMSRELLLRIRDRFPGHPLPGYEWTVCADGKLRPFRGIRLPSYALILELLKDYFPGIPVRMSMELPFVLNLLEFC
ncbi:MAG TPA: hypothetical protein PLV45_15935, partial [bacterium]|nr:hypothetical protein [bacterium]